MTLRFIRTYYPGVDNFSEAELIKIEFGDSVGGIQFQIPSDKSIYYLKGYVLFEDTTFRLGGEVQLRTTNDFTNSDLIEKSSINVYNKFSMMLLEGMEGWIHFKITGLYPKSETNPEIEIPEPFYFKPEKDIVDMKVIIHKKNGK